MSNLNIYNAAEIKQHPMTALLYAPPGMGKTTTIGFLPGKTLLLDVDRTSHVLRGKSNVDIIEVDNVDTWNAWRQLVPELVANNDIMRNYDNIVVDNVSELERCILASLGRAGKNNGVPAQADYQYMQFRMVDSLRYLKNLGRNLIWTAWETIDAYTTSEGQTFDRAYPQINKKIINNVCGLCDIVGRLMIKEDGERGYTFTATNSIYAKNQLDDRKGCKQAELIVTNTARGKAASAKQEAGKANA